MGATARANKNIQGEQIQGEREREGKELEVK